MPDQTHDSLFGPDSTNLALPIGDNLHDLSDKQLAKLVQLKFHNEPFRLLRQLSKDLAAKETELILLRKEKFQREQELVRLCTTYGNLSALEVDQHLNALPIEENVHKVVSQLISSAMSDTVSPRSRSSEATHTKSRNASNTSLDLKSTCSSLTSKSTPHVSSAAASNEPEAVSGSHNNPTGYSKSSSEADRRTNWRDWFSSSDENSSSGSTTRLNSRIRSLSITSYRRRSLKRPVELQSIGDTDNVVEKDANTDKYGFYTNVQALTPKVVASALDPASQESDVSFPPTLVPTATITRGEASETIDRLKLLNELSDAHNVGITKRWDTFMHGVRKGKLMALLEEDSQLFGVRALNLRRSESRLSKFFVSGEDEQSDDFYHTILNLVREGGISPKYRNALWFELSGAKNREVRGEFRRLVDLSFNSKNPLLRNHLEQVDLDLHRTLPSNSFFNDMTNSQPGPHLYKLQNILYAFVAYKPEIGYAQGMNKVIGNLLLGVNESNALGTLQLTEEDVFWIFVSITEEFVPTYGCTEFFHPEALLSIQRDIILVQSVYAPKLLPKLFAHLKNVGIEIQMVLLRWWLGIFTESFSSVELWFKIFDDLLLSESADVKFVSYSLAILKILERNILELSDADEIYRLLSNLNSQMVGQTNIRFRDLMNVNNEFEKNISPSDLKHKRESLGSKRKVKRA